MRNSHFGAYSLLVPPKIGHTGRRVQTTMYEDEHLESDYADKYDILLIVDLTDYLDDSDYYRDYHNSDEYDMYDEDREEVDSDDSDDSIGIGTFEHDLVEID